MSQLYGRIASVHPDHFEVFTSLKSHQLVKCIYKIRYFPIQPGDSICCDVEEKGQFLKVTSKPWVLISNDKENIVSLFSRILVKTRKDPELFYQKLLVFSKMVELNFEKTEQEVKMMINTEEEVLKLIQNLNSKASEYITDKSFLLPDCNFETTINILKLWYKERVLRQLFLYGLSKVEIMGYLKYSRKTANDLLTLCFKRPTGIFSIDEDKLEIILAQTRALATKSDLKYYSIARKLYKNLQEGENCIERENLKDPEILILQEYYSVTCYQDRLYLNYVRFIEERLAYLFNVVYPKVGPVAALDESKIPSYLNKEQKEAFIKCITNSCTTVSGCAGSGKTTLIKELYRYYQSLGKVVILSALTGKAVSRLREVSKSRDPRTLHSLIKAISGSKVKIDVLIIDEMSMLNGDILYRILKLLAPYYPNLIFSGDYFQLPNIGAFSLDMTQLSNVCHLTFCQRFDGDILNNSQRILQGKKVVDSDLFKFIDGNIGSVAELYKDLSEENEDIQILSPYVKAVDEINSKIQSIKQENKEWVRDKSSRKWVEGDRVIFLENNLDLDIFNGEEGKIIKITDEMVKVQFMDKQVELKLSEEENQDDNDIPTNPDKFIEYTPLGQLSTKLIKLSYCLTVHKAQGSEWSIVLFYLPFNNSDFINRNLIYTGVTRGKDCVMIIGKILHFSSCCKKIKKNFTLDLNSKINTVPLTTIN